VLALILGASLADPRGRATADDAKITPRIQSRIELGRRLFYEPHLSRSGQRSCASCHAPEHGFSDPDRVSLDDIGTSRRHSQTIIDSKWNPSAHWDGEFSGVEELITRRLGNQAASIWQRRPPRRTPITPGTLPVFANQPVASGPVRVQAVTSTGPIEQPFLEEFALARTFTSPLTAILQREGRYAEAFKAAFGKSEVTLERVALAIAAYCYSVESTESAFDRYRQGDKSALSRSQKRGMLLFIGRAGCAECHKIEGSRPLLTDFAFHNTGVTYQAVQLGRPDLVAKGSDLRFFSRFLAQESTPEEGEPALVDRGRIRLSRQGNHERAFKTPTLRDVTRRTPYMHNGALDTLEQVVRWYAEGCGTDPDKGSTLAGFRCSERDVKDLVAFLESLTGDERPGLAKRAWSARAKRTTITFLSGETPLADIDVKLVPVGDPIPTRLKNGESPDATITLRTNRLGRISYTPRGRTHMRVVLPDDIPTKNSALIPDTTRRATIQAAVLGEMKIVVTFPAEWPAPPVIVAEHISAKNAPLRGHPRTIFRRTGVVEAEAGKVARYAAWVRGDVPPSTVLRFPGLTRSRRGVQVGAVNLRVEAGTTRRIDLTAN